MFKISLPTTNRKWDHWLQECLSGEAELQSCPLPERGSFLRHQYLKGIGRTSVCSIAMLYARWCSKDLSTGDLPHRISWVFKWSVHRLREYPLRWKSWLCLWTYNQDLGWEVLDLLWYKTRNYIQYWQNFISLIIEILFVPTIFLISDIFS